MPTLNLILAHVRICGLPDVSLGVRSCHLPLSRRHTCIVWLCNPTSTCEIIQQSLSSTLRSSANTSITIPISVRNLDRIRVFRRRQDSPGRNPDDREPRERSPGWFQRMHRNMSSSKRSRSSSTQPDIASEIDRPRPETVTQSAASRDHIPDRYPKMPLFLQQSPSDVQAKFHELTWIERNRIAQGTMDPSPDHPWAIIQGPHTKMLDRYQNVHPWKHNRIHLHVPEGQNDYINASPISLKSPKTGRESKYIAMQGPKEGSTSHVWRMIWDELTSPAVIVMLTETHEAGMEKCFPYFPRDPDASPLVINENDEFGDGFKATVKCFEVDADPQAPSTEVRKLVMNVDGQEQEKIIWHLLYTKWPDFGVLAVEDLNGFFQLMELSNQKNSGPENPRIIHCSAGVGRSGTFIALEHLIAELEAGALVSEPGEDEAEYDPVFDTVNRLREQRRTMVQADSQYLFIYNVLRQLWEQKHSATAHPPEKTNIGEPTAKVAKLGEMEDVFS